MVTRLQIGTAESRNSAMDSLLSVLNEDDKHVLIAVAQGVVPVLVRLLDCSSSFETREKTVSALSRVSTVDSSKHALIAEGLVLLNNLLRVVESGSGVAREKACIALKSLTHSKENARAIGSRGGISSLLGICEAGTPSSQAAAAGVLRDLSMFDEIKENFIEENAVHILLTLFASGTNLAQENAIGCLCNLVSDDFELKLLVAREGGVESLKNYWDSASNVKSLEVAVELVRNLATLNPICEILVSNGFVNRVVSVLNCGVLGVRISAAKAVYELGSFNTKTRKELGELGCIPPLVRMMEGKVGEERESAAKALYALMGFAANRKVFRKEERGIVSAVQLLDPLTRNLDKKYPVSLLSSIVHSKKCRKQMIAAGACVFLQKLVEMDVEGAKKLLENLGKGKIWGVFARP